MPPSPALTGDVAILGATPGGVLAALTAARLGRDAILVATGGHVGGLLSSGLSVANLRYRHVHAGPFDEFARLVLQTYVERYGAGAPVVQECRGGTWWEPHVAEGVFEGLLAGAPRVRVLRGMRLVGVRRRGQRVHGFTVEERGTGVRREIEAPVSLDATYEGDLAAGAGVPYRVGREARSDFWEPHAGRVVMSARRNEVFPGSTGEGDRRMQAFCYRLCVTQRPDLRVPFPRPAAYDRDAYPHVLRALAAGRVRRLLDVMLLGPERVRVNGKADVIANLVGGADAWPEADEATRERLARRHRDYTLGLFWLLQHDAAVPDAVREEAQSWGLAGDEFAANGHWPYELYVREGRRIRGRATATEHDFLLEPGKERSPLHDDAVAVADYVIDSHPTQHLADPPYVEGHVNLKASQPGQVRFGSLVPVDAGGEVEGLLVPVAVSSTHLGFAAIRMEPVWMALGAVAATAAHLALAQGVLPHALPVERLQAELARRGHRLAFFYDVPLELHCPGLQALATKGFFDTPYARPHDPVTRFEATEWLARILDGARGGAEGAGGAEAPGTPAPARATPPSPAFPDVPAVGALGALGAAVSRLSALGVVDAWHGSAGFCGSAHLANEDAGRWVGALARVMGVPEPPPPGGAGAPYAPMSRLELCEVLWSLRVAAQG